MTQLVIQKMKHPVMNATALHHPVLPAAVTALEVVAVALHPPAATVLIAGKHLSPAASFDPLSVHQN
jgi:hypothetical protein